MAGPYRPSVVIGAPVPKPAPLSLLAASPYWSPNKQEPDVIDGPADRWVNGYQYLPHSHAAAENRDPCDVTSSDLPAIAAPSALALTAGAGTLPAGTYSYRVTAINGNGETTPGPEQTITVPINSSVTLSFPEVKYATGYRIYGRAAGAELLMAEVDAGYVEGGPNPTYVDTGAAAPAGALPTTNTTAGPGTYTVPGIVAHYPTLIIVEDRCSPFGFEEHDFIGRARTLLDNATPNAVEREFWTGRMASLGGYPNNFLTNAASVTDLTPGGGPPSVKRGLQILEDALQSCGFGGQGMIHVQPQTAPDLTGARFVGNVMTSAVGNIIVPGSGYPGTGPGGTAPAAGTSWMYATDLVACFTSSPVVVPDNIEQAMDRDTNLIIFRAQRFGAASFDAFCHFGVRVTLAT